MKAVVVEIKDGFAAILLDDGRIEKIRDNNYIIGEAIIMEETNKSIKKINKIIIWASSAAVLLILIGIGTWTYMSPYTYVSLDVNPSIEYSLNRFDRVLSVNAVNDDGEDILEEIGLDNLDNKNIEDAVELTIDQISSEGYFDSDTEGGMIIATSCEDTQRAEQLASELGTLAQERNEINGDVVEVESISVGFDRVQEAKELDVTPGKLNLVQKLQESAGETESIDTEEWLNKPVKDIMKAIKENRKSAQSSSENSESETSTEQSTEQSTEANLEQETNMEQNNAQGETSAKQQETNAEQNGINNSQNETSGIISSGAGNSRDSSQGKSNSKGNN